MKSYRLKVENAARDRNGEPLYNGSLEHAAVLAETMFKHAQHQVNVFSGQLDARVFGTAGIIENAQQFLSDKSHKVRILVEDPERVDGADHPFVKKFADNDDVSFRKLPSGFAPSAELDYHFMVMDEDSYRFEKSKAKPSAIAAFGDKVGGEKLTEVFDVLWNASEPLEFNDASALISCEPAN